MSDTIITVENLSKRYRLGVIGATSLRESIERGWHRLRGRDWREAMGEIGVANQRSEVRGQKSEETSPSSELRSPSSDLWALRDVSFEVKRGEVLGVIGRNGAGKSTLLKILTRVTEPTSGRAIMRGRVASLLEVGTGFHPELTGRENVYLNGAILGMRRAEITAKFDEIVAFAEVEKFIDTPVKRYSSGMYVRLAFAVAAHLEPEILLVDEVLAVGDVAFQNKCIGKMSDVAKAGRTVLFVSHNLSIISRLCPSSVLLNYGRLECKGNSDDVITQYIDLGREKFGKAITGKNADGSFEIHNFSVTMGQVDKDNLISGDDALFRFEYSSGLAGLTNCRVSIAIHDMLGSPRLIFSTEQTITRKLDLDGYGVCECRVPSFPLPVGKYYVTLYFERNGQCEVCLDKQLSIQIIKDSFFPGRHLPKGWEGKCVMARNEWVFRREE